MYEAVEQLLHSTKIGKNTFQHVPVATLAQICNTYQLPVRGSYTEPRILMDSIRSPGRLLKLHQESTWSASGVHLESIWTSLKVATTVHYQGILLDSIRMETVPGLLIQSCQNPSRTPHIVQMDSTHANLINCYCQKTNVSTRIRTQDLRGTNNDACNHSAIWPQRFSNNKE